MMILASDAFLYQAENVIFHLLGDFNMSVCWDGLAPAARIKSIDGDLKAAGHSEVCTAGPDT